MPHLIPANIETFTALTADDEGNIEYLAAVADQDKPSLRGNLVPWYVLSDRGTYFVPGSGKKTAKEQLANAPHLFQHWADMPIGKHSEIGEKADGLHIAVHINEDVTAGRELMSNLRFGVPMGLSAGIDRVAWRSGTKEDDAVLNRKTAPDFLRKVPITELTAITEFRLWESSSVTFPAIGTAKAHEVNAASSADLMRLKIGLKDGTLSESEMSAVQELVTLYEAAVAGTTHHTEPDGVIDHAAIVAVMASYHGFKAREVLRQ